MFTQHYGYKAETGTAHEIEELKAETAYDAVMEALTLQWEGNEDEPHHWLIFRDNDLVAVGKEVIRSATTGIVQVTLFEASVQVYSWHVEYVLDATGTYDHTKITAT